MDCSCFNSSVPSEMDPADNSDRNIEGAEPTVTQCVCVCARVHVFNYETLLWHMDVFYFTLWKKDFQKVFCRVVSIGGYNKATNNSYKKWKTDITAVVAPLLFSSLIIFYHTIKLSRQRLKVVHQWNSLPQRLILPLGSILSTLHQLQTAQSRMSVWRDEMEGVMDGEIEGAMEQLGAAVKEQLE